MDNCSQDTLFGSHSPAIISTAPIPANNEREVKKGLKTRYYSALARIAKRMDTSAPGQQYFLTLIFG